MTSAYDDIGLLEAGLDITQNDLDALGDIGGLLGLGLDAGGEQVVVQERGVGPHGFDDVDHVREHLVLHVDELQRAPGDRHARGGHRRDRVALVERLLARHHVPDDVLVVHHHLAGRDELRGLVGEIVPGDHGLDAGQRLGLRRVDRDDARVGVRAPQHPPDQLARQVEVGAEAGATRHLVDAVGANRAGSDVRLRRPVRHRLGHGYPFLIVAAASITALTILSYPVHRQRLPASQ